MDFNPSKSRNGNAALGRVRGVILSPHGWQRFQTAKQQAEVEEIWSKHFTQEDLRDRTLLSLNTMPEFSNANWESIATRENIYSRRLGWN